ncbi:MAG: alpha-hydroxy acid oxidase [Cyclobacteriaceae bacterium]
MKDYFNSDYPSSEDLKARARRKIPRYAFEYLTGGANDEINLKRNYTVFDEVQLMPEYIRPLKSPDLSVDLFGENYSTPFGIAPIGLQGLIYPNSPLILAKAASDHQIPFILSTVTTASIEEVARETNGRFWFQLYYPADEKLKKDLLDRAWENGCRVLVALADTPSFGIRYKDVKNGLSMPPKLSVRNIMQIMGKPGWAGKTLILGRPNFASLEQYMPKGLNLSQLGKFMNETFDGRLTEDKLALLREQWKGKLVVKGIVNERDAEKVASIGADGIIVSNHGGRQLDAGESSLKSMERLSAQFKNKLTIMMDGGIDSGSDVVKSIASGAEFCFLGRTFMYGVGALGSNGGLHTINMLKMQMRQVMDQLGCESISELSGRLIKE